MSTSKFIEGDKIKFKTSGNIIPEFVADGRLGPGLTIHGQTNFKENKGEVVAISNGFIVVSYIDAVNKKVQLGFKERDLELIEEGPNKKKFRISYVSKDGEIKRAELEGRDKDGVVSTIKDLKHINYVIEG